MTAPYPPRNGSEPCASGQPNRFFPEKSSNGRALDRVKAECTPCHIKDECLAYALTHRVDGIWAGKTVEERDAIRKREGIVAEAMSFAGLTERTPRPGGGDHGSWAGIARHRKRYEPLCDDCRAYGSQQSSANREKRKRAAAAAMQAAS